MSEKIKTKLIKVKEKLLKKHQLKNDANRELNFKEKLKNGLKSQKIKKVKEKLKNFKRVKEKISIANLNKNLKKGKVRRFNSKLRETILKNGLSWKFQRIYYAYTNKNLEYGRMGNCIRCGKCCKLPFRCIFYFKNRCLIYKFRFKPCRVFPARRNEILKGCGFWFKE